MSRVSARSKVKVALLALCLAAAGSAARAQSSGAGAAASSPGQPGTSQPGTGQLGTGQAGAARAGTASPPTFRVNSTVVLVPTLVEQKNGDVVYELGTKDFSLTDNGVPQVVHVDDDMDTVPVSLVVCVEKGRSSALEFGKLDHLAPLLNLFLGTGTGRVSLVEFDSQVEYQSNWTSDTDEVQHDLDHLQPGDGGAALLDAADVSVRVLEQQPANRRRILLLVSESRDHGSKLVSSKQLVEEIGASNTLVLSLTWSPTRDEYLEQLEHPGTGGLNVLELLTRAVNAMKANAARSLAVMSGGESVGFGSERSFEDRVAEMASHARNRYMLSFHPTDLTPGLHSLQVKLTSDVPGRVVARTDYWAGPLGEDVDEPATPAKASNAKKEKQ